MIKLRSMIRDELKEIHPRVYYNRAPADVAFPYISFNFPNSFMSGEVEVHMMDVDVWARGEDTTQLEQLTNSIVNTLHKTVLHGDEINVALHRETRLSPDDDDPQIKRRRLTFQARCLDNEIIRR